MTASALFDLFVSLGIGVLAGLGVGSGGILILYLTAIDGMAQHAAQGLNLAVFSFALGAALLVHLQKREVPLPVLLFVVLFGVAGAVSGALLSAVLSAPILRTGLGVMLVAMGIYSLFRK